MANDVHSFDGFNSSADPVFNSEKLSKVLQIMYSKGVYGQISEEHKEYEMIKKMKVGEEVGRSLNFQLNLTLDLLRLVQLLLTSMCSKSKINQL